MKIQKNKQLETVAKHRLFKDKTTALKGVTIGFGIAIVAMGITGFVCDCNFVSKGIGAKVDYFEIKGGITEETLLKLPYIQEGGGDKYGYGICNKLATVTLSLLGAYIILILSYGVICGINVKKNIKYYIYQIIASAISFIGITICIIEAAQMMVNEKGVLDITFLPPAFNVFHLDYLKGMSVAFGFTIFTNVLMLCTFRGYDKHTIIRDCNLLVLILGFASALMFIPFMLSLGGNDRFIGGATGFDEGLALATHPTTGKHITCQCITSPMGVLAGMVMVLLVIRLVTVVFVYNKRGGEKKSHIIIFSAITFLMFASFVVAHANKLDFEKLINKYNELKLGVLLVVLAQSFSCLASGTYCLISHINYQKNINR